MDGPKKPARLPSELIHAIPAAAAVPASSAVGIGQKRGKVARIPTVATLKPIIAASVLYLQRLLATMPAAPSKDATAKWTRRSPERSELRPKSTIATAPHPYGMAVSKPTYKGSFTPVFLISCGI